MSRPPGGSGSAGGPTGLGPHELEDRLPALLAIALVAVGQGALPRAYGLSPHWLAPALEGLLLLVLLTERATALELDDRVRRAVGLVAVAAVTVDNTWTAASLDAAIVSGSTVGDDAGHLLVTGLAVYATNVVAFGLWFWLLDRGGPTARARGSARPPDLLFPQMSLQPPLVAPGWHPTFPDYLYTAFTGATAFSPTDVMPLTRWAKALLTAESSIALVTTGLVVARAVNVLR